MLATRLPPRALRLCRRPQLRLLQGIAPRRAASGSSILNSWPSKRVVLVTGSFITGWALFATIKSLTPGKLQSLFHHAGAQLLLDSSTNEGDLKRRHEGWLAPEKAPALPVDSRQSFQYPQPLSPEEVTERLQEYSWSFPTVGLPGIARYDGAQLPSNPACEDRFIHGVFLSPWNSTRRWGAWGVFDGHVGGETSEALSHYLLGYVHRGLRAIFPQTGSKIDGASGNDGDIAAVAAIQDAFESLDDLFVKPGRTIMDADIPFAEKTLRLSTASNGSCALLALFDPANRLLRVACTGDSRAVLGRQTASGSWEAVALSEDQTGSNEAEIARIQAEHPGEEDVVKGGRVVGLMCSRAFGDAHWKWTQEMVKEARKRFNADGLRAMDPKFKTPPYITARPEVTTTRLPEGQPAFMILATDGLWDSISSEQAVDLVGRWLEWQKAGRPAAKEETPDFGKFDFASLEEEYAKDRTLRAIATQDDNVAVHLVRNALGGTHHDLVSAVLGFKPPFARDVRDDITVQVVFFE